MKILLIFWTFSLISGNTNIDVTGYTGGNLLLDSGRSSPSNAQYLRKQINGRWNIIIDNNKQNPWINEGRFTLYLHKNRNIMLFIRELNEHDSGRYKIGLSHSDVEIDLTVISDSCCVVKTVEVRRGRVGIFRCKYSQNHINDAKIVLKEGKDSIDEMIKSTWKTTGRFSLSDRRDKQLITVRISSVTPDDGGVYLCGVWINRVSHSYSIISTVHLHIIMDVLATYKMTGSSGAHLMIKCEHPQHKTKPKYICKESDGCSEKKSPGVQDQWEENGDVSLYDDTGAGVLMVFFRELKDTDGGRYRCGVNESDYTERFTELQLNIRHDPKYLKSTTESVHLGGEINITCQIPEEHKLHFCKEDENHICRNISSSKVSETSPSSERNEERVLSVSFSNVSVRDAGVYWCGAETRDTHLTFISLSSRIQLILLMSPVVRREGESAEIICPYDSLYKSKSLCKGKCSTRDRNPLNETLREEKEPETDRLTLNDDATASVFTGTITALTAEDAGEYWCAETFGKTLDYLYTHLIVIMNEELSLTQYKGDNVSIQCKRQNHNQKIFCKAHEASMCVKDGVSLETIRDDRFSFSDEASAGVFTVTITDLRAEDSGTYWCGAHDLTKVYLNIKKVKDSSMILIISVCVILLLITGFALIVCKLRHQSQGRTSTSEKRKREGNTVSSCSDRRHDCLSDSGSAHNNSHEEVPTIPSDGLLYTSVTFQRHEESLSDAAVAFSIDSSHCDYATVIFRTRLN